MFRLVWYRKSGKETFVVGFDGQLYCALVHARRAILRQVLRSAVGTGAPLSE